MLGLVRKKCRPLVVATVVISVILVQAFFLARLLTSKTPSEDKSSVQFVSLLRHFEAAKKPLESLLLDRKSPASDHDMKSQSQVESHNKSHIKPKVISASGRLSLSAGETVGALPQRRASLRHHHFKRQHLDKPVIDPMAHAFGPEVLVETNRLLTPRPLTESEQAGNNILFTLRTTVKFHKTRLPVLFDTWLTKVNRSNVFLVTDGEDKGLKGRDGKLFTSLNPGPNQPPNPNRLYS